jgi:hypothetical protein
VIKLIGKKKKKKEKKKRRKEKKKKKPLKQVSAELKAPQERGPRRAKREENRKPCHL